MYLDRSSHGFASLSHSGVDHSLDLEEKKKKKKKNWPEAIGWDNNHDFGNEVAMDFDKILSSRQA